MNSIEFGKKCRPLNIQYRELFGYVPCRQDYKCSQEEYFSALQRSVSLGKELIDFLEQYDYDFEMRNDILT